MKTENYKEIESKKYVKLQELKGEENYVSGKFIGTEEGTYSPVFIIEKPDGSVIKIIGTTDLIDKMRTVDLGTGVKIGLKEERLTKNQLSYFVAYVGALENL